MAEAVEYIAKGKTFVDGVLKRPGEKFVTDQKPSKMWEPVKKPEAEGDESGEQKQRAKPGPKSKGSESGSEQ